MSDEHIDEGSSADVPTGGPTDADSAKELSKDGSTVLELFGVELKVRNERLADVLKMDAKEALGTDVKELADGQASRRRAAEAAEAVPEVILSPATAREEAEAHDRAEVRQRVSALGGALGFDVRANGEWSSPSGVGLITRVVDRVLSPAAAVDLVSKVEQVRPGLLGPISSSLFSPLTATPMVDISFLRCSVRSLGNRASSEGSSSNSFP